MNGWLLDGNIPALIAEHLSDRGHDVLRVSRVASGAADADVIAIARAETRTLVSPDLDHGDLTFGQHVTPPRAVVLLHFGY